MHGPINVKSPNNTSKWQMGFNSAFKGLNSTHLMNKYPATSLNKKFLSPALTPFQMTPFSTGASIVTRQHRGRPRNPGSIPVTVKTVIFYKASRPALGTTQPSVQSIPRIGPSHEHRRGREVDHSSPSIAEAKNKWRYLPPPAHHMTPWRVTWPTHSAINGLILWVLSRVQSDLSEKSTHFLLNLRAVCDALSPNTPPPPTTNECHGV
jgi:hypothetical protein